jgi:hypothetical protein
MTNGKVASRSLWYFTFGIYTDILRYVMKR